MKLGDYQKKRDAARTNEPLATASPKRSGPTVTGGFVVHLHEATHRHYDLRLEVGGVLASFAVPRGPSLDPDEKRFAMHIEDHPLDYLDFEAVIPAGNYGAGPMILWDRGAVRYLEAPAEVGLDNGKLDFTLAGHKLKGRFALVRLKGKKGEWLFFKKKDPFSSKDRDVTISHPRSILSGLTVEELGDAPAIAARIEARAAELGAPARRVDARRVSPMLCSTPAHGHVPTHGDGWLYELKLDGVRIVGGKSGEEVSLTYRSARDTTAAYPEVTRALRALAASRVVLDGEIVAFDDLGQPNFQRLGQRIHLVRAAEVRRAMLEVPVVYVVFDLLALGERDLTPLPLSERKRLLTELLPAPGVLRVLDHLEGDGRPLLAFCRERHLEGVVAKKARAPYRPGPKREGDWVKMKCERDEDFVVVGWTRGESTRDRLGALDIATYAGGKLVVRGKVGSGLDDPTIRVLLERMGPLAVPEAMATGKFGAATRGRTFVKPEIVVSVRFLGWSDDGSVRFPVFRGILADRPAEACAAAPPSQAEVLARLALPSPETAPAEEPEATLDTEDVGGAGAPIARRAAVSNRSKVLWPGEGITKGELCDYYDAIGATLIPYLEDRPIILVRYPDGIDKKSFFQWNVPQAMPAWVRSFEIRSEDEDGRSEKRVFIVNDADSLLYVANLACVPIHILSCRKDSLGECDFFTIDLDLKGASFADAVTLARTLRELLDAIGLQGFPKTSGQTGLHVLVPVGPGVGYPTARALCDLLARLMEKRHPELGTLERVVNKRRDRVYIDTVQTGPTRAIVAPYSVRAHPGAPVSTPLTWDEVTPDLDPRVFTIRTVIERVRRLGDPMAPMLGARPSIGAAVVALERLLGSGNR